MVPRELSENPSTYTQYRGIGNARLFSYGRVPTQIKFRNRIGSIDLFIIADDVLPVPLLLGRDFLDEFGIKLMQFAVDKTDLSKISALSQSRPKGIAKNRVTFRSLIPKPFVPRRTALNKIDPTENLDQLAGVVSTYCYFCAHDSTIFGNFTVSAEHIFRDGPGECTECRADLPLQAQQDETPAVSDVSTSVSDEAEIFAIDLDSEPDGIDIDERLSAPQRGSLTQIIRENYLNWSDIPEIDHDFEMETRLTSDIPFHFAPRRLSAHHKTEVRDIVSDLLSQGIIRPSDSPYASPIVLVKVER